MAIDLTTLPKVPARWRRPRTTPPIAICIHTIESPETPTGAENCAAYFATITRQAGAHYTIDSDSIVECVDPARETTPHCYGPSAWSIGLEHAGTARQTAADWADPYSNAELELSAQLTAALCHRFGIPPVRLLPAQVARREPGIFGHHDATIATAKAGGHTDPGPGFPWGPYIGRVRQLLTPPAPTIQPPTDGPHEETAMSTIIPRTARPTPAGRWPAAILEPGAQRLILRNGLTLTGVTSATALDGTQFIDLTGFTLAGQPVTLDGHAVGLAESPAGDIVIVTDTGATYTFAPTLA